MIKQFCVAMLMTSTGLMSSLIWGARDEYTFEVSLSVPNRSFYILPADSGWIHREQILPWNPATSTLGNVRKYFDVRYSDAIEARLESRPYLANADNRDKIKLNVLFNGVLLSHTTANQVVTASDARQGSRVLLEIQPQLPPGGYKSGDYYGSILLLFNAIAPGS